MLVVDHTGIAVVGPVVFVVSFSPELTVIMPLGPAGRETSLELGELSTHQATPPVNLTYSTVPIPDHTLWS